jgi:hypothetical protein
MLPRTRRQNRLLTMEQATAAAGWADSYSRLGVLLDLRASMDDLEWWRLFGQWWSSCDNIASYTPRVRPMLLHTTPEQRQAMMDARAKSIWAALPNFVTVYRGCYAVNRDGLSWTLSRETAAIFPTLSRYRRLGDVPLLLTGIAAKALIVMHTDREEDEVICPSVETIDETKL